MVPAVGIEPTWSCPRRILSPLRLPVSPRRHGLKLTRTAQSCQAKRLATSRPGLYNISLMLTGYNTDFKYQGTIYHVQTEDGGVNSPYITSLLYHQGAILASRKTSYGDIIKADCLDEVVRELMMEQHKQMIRDLMQGKLEVPGVAPQAAPQQAPAPKPAPAPVAPAVVAQKIKEEPKEKSLDDIILEFLAQEDKKK